MLARSLLLLAVVIWGWTFVATKVCLQVLDPLQLLALRFVVALPCLGLLLRLRGVRLNVAGHGRVLLVASGVFFLHFVLQIHGLERTSATNTGWIIAVIPLVLAVLSRLILRERIRGRTWLGIAVSTAGILLLVSRGRLADLAWLGSVGDWLVLGSAHTWALYTIAVRDLARARDPLVVTLSVLLPATLAAVVVASLHSGWSLAGEWTGATTAALLFLAIPGTALAHWFWQVGVAHVGAAEAGVFLYLEPLATTALAVPYLGEPFTAATAAGGALVLAGVACAQRRARTGTLSDDRVSGTP